MKKNISHFYKILEVIPEKKLKFNGLMNELKHTLFSSKLSIMTK